MKRRLFALFLALVTVLQPVLPAAAEEPEAETTAYVTEEAAETTAAPADTAPAPTETTQETTVSTPEETTAPIMETTAAATETTVAPQESTEPEPVSYAVVRLVCGMDGVAVHVYPAATEEKPEPEEILPQGDGSYHLLPGEYVCRAEGDGETPTASDFFLVTEEDVGKEIEITIGAGYDVFVQPPSGTGTTGGALWKQYGYYMQIYGGSYMADYGPDDYKPWATGCNYWVEIRNLIRVGSNAFRGEAMETLKLDSTVQTIGTQAFQNCKYLRGVAFPDSLRTIERGAFSGTGLVVVGLPAGVRTIMADAFADCPYLDRVLYGGSEEEWKNVSIADGNEALRNAEVIYNFSGDAVKYVSTGNGSSSCDWILDGGNQLTMIGNGEIPSHDSQSSWSSTKKLVLKGSMSLPSNYTSTFSECTNLEEVVIYNNASLGQAPFKGCQKLRKVTFPNSWVKIPDKFFSQSGIVYYQMPERFTQTGQSAFENCTYLKYVNISDGCTTIDARAFYGCSSLKSIYIPASVTQIGDSSLYSVSHVYYGGTQAQWNRVSVGSGNSLPTPEFSHVHSYDTEVADRAGGVIYVCECGSYTHEPQVIKPSNIITASDLSMYTDSAKAQTIFLNATALGGAVLSYQSSTASVTVSTLGIVTVAKGFSGTANITITAGATADYKKTTKTVTVTVKSAIDSIAASGSYGTLRWELTESGTFTLSGNGSMAYSASGYPWDRYVVSDIHRISIGDGVTSIAKDAFWGCEALENLTLGSKVQTIGENAFFSSALTQVVLPAAVRSISDSAFSSPTLESIYVDSSNTTYCDINGVLFTKNKETLILFPEGRIGTYIVPSTTRKLAQSAFSGTQLAEVQIPEGVTDIGRACFAGGQISKVTLPDTLRTIGTNAFFSCAELKAIDIPGSVETIGQSAFDGTGLKEVTIGDGVASIGEEAFLSCPMTIVTLPESVTRIGAHAIGYVYQARDYQKIEGFIVRGVPGSTAHQYATNNGFAFASSTGPIANTITASDIHVYVDDTKAQTVALNASALGGAALSYRSDNAAVTVSANGIATVAKGFKGAAKITITTEKTDLYLQTSKVITLTASGTGGAFGDLTWALSDDGALTIAGSGEMGSSGYPWEGYASTVRRLEVKTGVTGIGRSAFSDFEALEEVVLADTVTTIDGSAFSMCGKLSKLNLGSGLRVICSHAFEFCDSLKEVNLPASASSISPSAFENCGNLQNFHVASGNEDYCDVDGVLFWAGKVLLASFPGGRTGSYTVPSSVKTIGDCAFYASKLTEVVLPSGLKTIGDECFRYSTVSQLTLPAGLANLGVGAFEGCQKLKTVTIPGSVKTISDSAFWGSGLESVTLEDGVTTIGKDAFLSCGLTKVTIPGTVTSIGEHALGYEVNRMDYDKVAGFTIFGVPGSAAQQYADSSGFAFKGTAAIVYDANGGTGAPAPTEKKRGSTAYLSTTRPVKTGYQFLGWAESPEAVTARYQPGGSYTRDEDITLYAVWKANTYSVRFYANDGTQTSATQASLNYDETYTLNANTFRRAGYTFLGWAESASGQVTYADQTQIRNLTETNNATVTLYAQWKPITYRVEFEPAGGEGQIEAITVQYDESFPMPAPNSLGRTGYRLYQWFDNPEYSYAGTYYSPNATVKNLTTEDGVTLVFYAHWEPNTYSVRFFANNGTGGVSVQSNFTYDSPKCLNANPFQRKGYTFAGWATDPEGPMEYADGEEVVNLTAENGAYIDFYARWEPTTYYLNQDADGGTGAQARVALHYGEPYILPGVQDVHKPGYMLTGWKGKIGKSTKTFKPGDQILNLTTVEGEEFTLTALWGPLKYTVRFVPGEGGTGKIKTQAMTYGKLTALAANGFKRTGYVFAGWRSQDGTLYDDKEKVSDLTPEPNGVVELTAQWQPVAYQLVFDANGGTGEIPGSGSLYNCGTGYRIPDTQPVRTGYRFLGWSTKAKGSVMFESGDGFRDLATANGKTVILYAVWQPMQYTLRFDGNGGSISVGAMTGLTCDKALTLPTGTFTRPGYVFTGWNTEADGTGTAYKNKAKAAFRTDTGAATLYAQWQQLKYTVTYKNILPSLNAGNPGTYTMAEGLSLQAPDIRGKTFEGWYLDAKFTTPFGGIGPGDGSARNLTVYAKWSGSAQEYGIWFFGSGATGGDTKYMEKLYTDKEYTLRANAFKRPGYRFLGWSREKDGRVEFTDKQKIVNLKPEAGSTYYVNLYAVWEPISYTVTYKGVTEEEIRQLSNPETFTAADKIPLRTPTRPGYRFEGWYETAKFTGYSSTIYGSLTAKNLTLYAKWTNGGTKYTVAFDGNGATSGKGSSKALSFCQDLKLTNMGFKRTGYQFLGWSTDPKAKEPAYVLGQTVHDLTDKAETVTLYAVWEAIPYTVTLKNVAGAQVPGSTAGTLTYTAAGLTLPIPSREGAVFEGWYTTANFKSGTALKRLLPGTTGDLTLYAKWRVQ